MIQLLSLKSFFLLTCTLITVHSQGSMLLSGFNFNSNPPNQYSDYSGAIPPQITCFDASKCLRLKHNDTVVADGTSVLSHFLSPLHVNDSGLYTCESHIPGSICGPNNENFSPIGNQSVLIIDSGRIQVPEWQFVFLNGNHTLMCDSDAYDLSINDWTREGLNETHVGVVTNAQLSDEGNYTCNFTILGNINKRTTQLIVLVKPQISMLENHLQTLVGPSLNNITITYTAKSPGKEIITWYHNGTELSDRVIHQSHDMGGASTLQVYRRHHKGTYEVIVTGLFNGLTVPEDIAEQSKTVYTFEVEITVPPSPPLLNTVLIESDAAMISLTPTNLTLDDAPDEIHLALTHNDHTVFMVTLTNDITEYTFTELTPSTEYELIVSVENIDKTVNGQGLTVTTATSEPSPSIVSIIRTDIFHFNLSLSFNHLGAPSLSIIKLGYRTTTDHDYHYIDITDVFSDLSTLNSTVNFSIDNGTSSVIANSQLQVILEVTNSAGHIATTVPVYETIVNLSNVSIPILRALTRTSLSMTIRLPLNGTPPILDISVRFSSRAHIYYHNISGYYVPGEMVNIDVGGDETFPLRGNTTYVVTARARNLIGWNNYGQAKTFTTYDLPVSSTSNNGSTDANIDDTVSGIVPSTESSSGSRLPIWAIVLSVVSGIALIVIIVSTVLFGVLIKKCMKRPKGYSVNEITAADRNRLDRSPGESRRVGKFFSYERPLMPRAATAEPHTNDYTPPPAYPPSSSHDDSDSESNLTGAPKYKYTVSPTPNEIGVQGFLGSIHGSGTYVYV